MRYLCKGALLRERVGQSLHARASSKESVASSQITRALARVIKVGGVFLQDRATIARTSARL